MTPDEDLAAHRAAIDALDAEIDEGTDTWDTIDWLRDLVAAAAGPT